ncbi:conidiation-specific expression [Pyrenophora seminiperda CCB06]|uniref:Conidiation-specific expression n=1 Tax=Pyrenophora seminiperda CCB06 TaxID=1302712 RepID=A0A3M7M7J3_9PLEO|nr:conidiation-specific expression [Pyrenophora seminiperda CCB06]
MPSPFQQKYSSQNHKVFGDNTTPAMPEGPKQDAERRSSESSIGSAPSPDGRRRSSAAQRFGNLEALKRRQDEESMARRQSLHEIYGKPSFIGTLWNNFTRGPLSTPSQK